MRHLLSMFFCLHLILSPASVTAQEAVPQALEIGPSGDAHLKSVRDISAVFD
jgi:hypothetical protein